MGKMFIQLEHETAERLCGLVADGHLGRVELAMLLLQVPRHGWGIKGKRNPCKIPLTAMAKQIGVSESSARRAMNNLKDLGIVKFIYRVRLKDKEHRSNKFKRYETLLKAGGVSLPTWFRLTEKGLGTNINFRNKG